MQRCRYKQNIYTGLIHEDIFEVICNNINKYCILNMFIKLVLFLFSNATNNTQ